MRGRKGSSAKKASLEDNPISGSCHGKNGGGTFGKIQATGGQIQNSRAKERSLLR